MSFWRQSEIIPDKFYTNYARKVELMNRQIRITMTVTCAICVIATFRETLYSGRNNFLLQMLKYNTSTLRKL